MSSLRRPSRALAAAALAATLGACATAPAAARGPIVTDRPDYTESPDVVPTLQVEAGATGTSTPGARETSVGELLLRVPVLPRLEARINVGSMSMARADGAMRSTYEDPEVQVKVALGAGDSTRRAVPALSLIAGTTLPLGARAVRAASLQPGAKLVAAWELSERVGLASNLNYAWLADGDRRFGQASVTASLGVALSGRAGSFFEYYDFLPGAPGAAAVHYGDAGLTYQLTPGFQLDLRAGTRLGGERERFVGVGLARRW